MQLFYFWKDHCAPCAAAKPIVEQVTTQLGLPVRWLNARAPEAGDLILGFGVMAVPTLVVVKDKKKVAALVGADLQNAGKLTKQLEKLQADE